MKIFIQLLIIAILIAVFSSCTTTLYTSNTINAPLLKQQGEAQLTITPNDAQAALAVTNHVGIIANGFYRNYKNGNNQHYGKLFELGVGKYHAHFVDHLIFEHYLGFGLGKIYKQQEFAQADNTTYVGNFGANVAKVFLQPSVGFASRFIDLAFTPRFSVVKYMNFTSNQYPDDQLREEYLTDKELTKSPYFFIDPAITLRAGYKFIKVQVQYGKTINMGNRIKHNSDFSSIGLVFNIGGYRAHIKPTKEDQLRQRSF